MSLRKVNSSGPTPARILIVGEAPGESEESRGVPFVGTSGWMLDGMLHEAGIARTECRVTNVVRYRPPGNDLSAWISGKKKDASEKGLTHNLAGLYYNELVAEGLRDLELETRECNPNLIIAVGNIALWALTGKYGIGNWRGSVLPSLLGPKCLVTYHPAGVLRQYEWRSQVVADLRRAEREARHPALSPSGFRFILRPGLAESVGVLRSLLEMLAEGPTRLSVDIETRSGHIACVGVAWSTKDALCIPLMCIEDSRGYWQPDEEAHLYGVLREVLTHPNARVVGQNFLYDAQYFARHLYYIPRCTDDTMLMQHLAFPGTQKSLAYMASLYCDQYIFWKEDGKLWDPRHVSEDQLWHYNCEDAVRTFEVADALDKVLDSLGFRELYSWRMRLWWATLRTMLRGIRIDQPRKNRLAVELMEASMHRQQEIDLIVGHQLNVRSAPQMKRLFYEDLRLPQMHNRKSGNVTLDDKALDTLETKQPLIRPLTSRIRELRSIGVFLSTFVQSRLDTDNRMRCSFNPTGTETFRFSSSENAFGSGTNLQNLPSGDER